MEIMTAAARAYVQGCKDELVELIETLCRIPAPSNHEESRAAFCKQWFEQAGARDVRVDEALNVVCALGDDGRNGLHIFMAHTDTVFPDLTPFEPVRDGNRLCCPGVGDDTANLAMLMLCARYFIRAGLPGPCGALFVANSGEEGLGNLKGSRQLMRDYGSRALEVISFDGGLGTVVNRAVGSDRYQIKLTAQGGHSYGKFGNTNAIHLLSCMVADLYTVTVPDVPGSKTTFNVGMISGGTSINTIAQTAEMLYEYRSDDRRCMAEMKAAFEGVVAKYRGLAEAVEVTLLGSRPCMGEVDPAAMQGLADRVSAVILAESGRKAELCPASTDCNIPYSMGIAGVSTGGYLGEGAHRREEWIDLPSLEPGLATVMGIIHTELAASSKI